MTIRFSTTSLAGAAILLAASMAYGDVVDFSLVGPGDFASYTEQGVTFTANGAGSLITSQDDGPTPNGTYGLIGVLNGTYPTLRADISGGATSVSVDLGDFDQDADGLFLQVYDSSNTLLGSASLTTDASDVSMHTLSVSDPDIAYALFGSVAPSLGGSSVFADNFTWDAAAATPEPSTLLLGAGGLITVLMGKRLRRKA